ncbi:MAG TPA: sulfur transferase domain-containing protein, partial [Gemmatimonadaceae bacterium]|nr:sulfur transferase domain-containing protein [Gemmatimonadaceae bacterium]
MVRQFLGIAAAAVLVAGAARGAAAQHMTGTGRIVTLPKPVALDTTGHFQAAAARVGDDIIITGQPSAQALRELRAQGVTTVVNLRMPEEMARVNFDEAATVAQLGMTYVTLPMRGTAEAPYAPAAVTKFADVMAHANGKVLLHCTVAWRASHLWAAYLIRERGVPVDEALANARAINLMDTHRMGDNGRQPVEDFLDRTLPTLGHPPAPPPSGAAAASAPAPAPAPATINGGLPAVSPDGKWIAFTRQGPGVTAGLYVIGVDGSNERRLADVPDGRLHWT